MASTVFPAASSGATLAEIAGVASPYGGTITSLGSTALTGASVTISSLSSYKYLKLIIVNGLTNAAAGYIRIRFNGATSNYADWTLGQGGNTYFDYTQSSDNGIHILYTNASNPGNAYLEIRDSNSSAPKIIQHKAMGYTSPMLRFDGAGVWNDSAAITSINISHTGGSFNSGTVYLMGAV
jgi:hypothetical protein